MRRVMMKHTLGSSLLGLAISVAAHADGCLDDDVVVDNQLIVRLTPGTAINDVLSTYARVFPGLAPLATIDALDAWLIAVPEPLCELEVIDLLEDDLRIQEITFNDVEESSEGQTQSFYFISIEGAFSSQPAWNHVGLAESQLITSGGGVTIAIIDTGIDSAHPVFNGISLLPGVSFVPGSIADVGDGIDNDNDGVIDESVGHGTHIAGVIGWMAPDAAILPIRVLDSDGFTDVFRLSQGIAAAVDQGADVINISIASPEASGVLDEVIAYAVASGVIVVASAGNFNDENMQYPAALPGVLSVAATSLTDAKSSFSSFGETIDLCAPGDAIVGPIPGGLYAEWSGTSMASALVAGAATLARAQAGAASIAHDALLATAVNIDQQNPNFVEKLGAGRLDVLGAVSSLNPVDLNGDGAVNSADLAILLGAWGICAGCQADLTKDGIVDASDLSLLLGSWG